MNKNSNTGLAMALGPVAGLFLAIGGLIGAAEMGHAPFVNVVDHQYDPAVAAEMNYNNCTTYAPRNDGSFVGVNCQQGQWRSSFRYDIPKVN